MWSLRSSLARGVPRLTQAATANYSSSAAATSGIYSTHQRMMATSTPTPGSTGASKPASNVPSVAPTKSADIASPNKSTGQNNTKNGKDNKGSGIGGSLFKLALVSILGAGTYAYFNQETLEPYAKEYPVVDKVLQQLKALPPPPQLPEFIRSKVSTPKDTTKAPAQDHSKSASKVSTESPLLSTPQPSAPSAKPAAPATPVSQPSAVKETPASKPEAAKPAPAKDESQPAVPSTESKPSQTQEKAAEKLETPSKIVSAAPTATSAPATSTSSATSDSTVEPAATTPASTVSTSVPVSTPATSTTSTQQIAEPTQTKPVAPQPSAPEVAKPSVPEVKQPELPAAGEPLTDTQAPLLMRDPTAVFEASLAKAALVGEVSSDEARRRVQDLFGSVMKELVEYETDRLHDTERLRYLISKGSQRSTVMLAKIERKDREFFDKLKYIVAASQKESQNLVDSSAQATNAKFAQSYMEDLIGEVEKVKQYVEVKFTEQLQLAAQQNRQELAEQYNKELLALSFRHAATVKELTSKYSEVFTELVNKVETLQKVLDLHRNHRQYAEFAQRIALSVVEVERKLDQGVPLDSAWNVLVRLAQDDPTVSAAIENVPEVVIKRGAAPLVHLQRRFQKSEANARTAAFIAPEGTFYSHVLARIFGALTAREVALVPVPKPEPAPQYMPFVIPERNTWTIEKTIPPTPESVAAYEAELAQHKVLAQSIQEQFAIQKARLQQHADAMAKEAEKAEQANIEAAKAAARSATAALETLLPPQLPQAPLPPAPMVVKETRVEADDVYQERIRIEENQHKEQYAKAVRDQEFFNTLRRDHARLARAGYKLQEADLPGVLTELRSLESERVAAAMGGFKTELEDRVALEQSIKLLRAHASSLYVDVAEQ